MAAVMDPSAFQNSPFDVVTFIAAPALLTNASSVLAMSTINRMLRTRDRMHDLYAKSRAGGVTDEESVHLVEQVDRVEKQAILMLGALRSIYVALGAFVTSTLVTLLGAGLAPLLGGSWLNVLAGFGVAVGFVGIGGLVLGCWDLFYATRISLVTIREEAQLVREHHAKRRSA
jgi:hypothetical protein